MNNPPTIFLFAISARMPMESISLPMTLSRAFHRNKCSLLGQILLLNSPNREKMDWLNYQLPAGKQPITATLFQAHYLGHHAFARVEPFESLFIRHKGLKSTGQGQEALHGPRDHWTHRKLLHLRHHNSFLKICIPIPKCKMKKYQMNSVS